jgi:phenylpropionate dioxygenase-like ring-hydroxylating dioxygenase large terminal subunit
MAECPYVGYPTGWFAAAWSHEVAVGEVKAVHYFGEDLVVWRGESGRAVVMDAYCAHMGCHLGIGAAGHALEHGGVVEDTVQCPFHGWRWDAEGANVEIPYSTRVNRRQKMRVWPTREIYGIWILVWYDALGRPPLWEPQAIPELDQPDEYYLDHDDIGWNNWGVIRQPLVCSAENASDGAHLNFVHDANVADSCAVVRDDGPIWESEFFLTFRNARGDEIPGGRVNMEHWGMGFLIDRLYGVHEVIQIFTPTPTDGWNCELRGMAFTVRDEGKPHPEGLAKRIIQRQLHSADEDANIFRTMRYVRRPPFAPEEARSMMAIRRWFRQFYPLAREVAGGDPLD